MYSLAISGPMNLFIVAIVILNTVQMIMLTSPYAKAMYGQYSGYSYVCYYAPELLREGHYEMIDSVCLSVACLDLTRERKGVGNCHLSSS